MRTFLRLLQSRSVANSAAWLTLACCATVANALPVVPGAVGFGLETPAGRGGNIVHVTTLAAEGPGSLKACIAGPKKPPYARTCVFDVGGVIQLREYLRITKPFITIAGQTAPPPGISLHGAGIRIKTSDVLIQHIRIRVGDENPSYVPHNRDAITVSNSKSPPSRIVIDHCSLALSSDEAINTWGETGDVTIIDSLIGPALHDSIHIDEGKSAPDAHGFGPFFGPFAGRVSMQRSLIAHHYFRNPQSEVGRFVFVNNVIYNWGSSATWLTQQKKLVTLNSLVGNVYKMGPDSETQWRRPLAIKGTAPGSRVYLNDNALVGGSGPLVQNEDSQEVLVDQAPAEAWHDGLSVLPSAQVIEATLAGVGAWATARDTLDARVVEETRSGTGTIINCVSPGGGRCAKHAGGWPKVATNARTFVPPDNPDADDDGDGYTNLEEVLHRLSLQAAGQ